MAYIRTHQTQQRDSRGRPVKTYIVVWREPVRDGFGLPQPLHPDSPDGPKLTRAQQETYASREEAEARRDELNAAKHTTGSAGLAAQRKAGDLPFGHYARAWLDAQRVKAASGDRIKPETVDGYEKRLAVYALPELGATAIGSITPAHCEAFLVKLVGRGLSPATLKHHWSTLRSVFVYAVRHKAIAANPVDGVDFAAGSNKRRTRRHYPLTADQVAEIAASVGTRYPTYELLTYFAAYTGLRAEEIAGVEIGDVQFLPTPLVKVSRAKKRVGGRWVNAPLKSAKSARSVDLPAWLATRLGDYLAGHPRRNEPTAPLWPNRVLGGSRARGQLTTVPLDFSEPVEPTGFYKNVLKPALRAVGLPASAPAETDDEGNVIADAVEGVRLHDLRHTFATLQLSAGVHFMQVSKWLGHSTFTLTLDTYGDWIPDEQTRLPNSLPEPTAPAKPAEATVLPFRRQSS